MKKVLLILRPGLQESFADKKEYYFVVDHWFYFG